LHLKRASGVNATLRSIIPVASRAW
jgi:hypothetical protein